MEENYFPFIVAIIISGIIFYAIIYFAVKAAINNSKLTENIKNINNIICWMCKKKYPESPRFETPDQRQSRIDKEIAILVSRLKNKEITPKEYDSLKQDLYK